MQSARRTAFATSPQQNNFDAYLRKENAPVGIASQMELDSQAQRQRSLTGVVERAGVKDIERKEKLGVQIDELKFKQDEYDKQKKDKFGDNLLQAGGAVVGAVAGLALAPATGGASVAAITPLMSTMFGAGLGASAGQVLGGFTGDNSEDISAGLGNAIQTFAQISTTKSNRELGSKMGSISKVMSTLPKDQRQSLLFEINTLKQLGDFSPERIDEILQRYGSSNAESNWGDATSGWRE